MPEVLFNPSDIGINQAGIAEAIVQTINKCPPVFQRQLYSNIVIGGGNANLAGFTERIKADLERLRPIDVSLGVHCLEKPTLAAWQGLKLFQADSEALSRCVVTRAQYAEEGGVRAANLMFTL